jgi:hypothetical protein
MQTTVLSVPSAFHSSEIRMELHVNAFKRALIERRQQIGLWCNLPSPMLRRRWLALKLNETMAVRDGDVLPLSRGFIHVARPMGSTS